MLQRRVAANPSRGVMSWGSRCRCRAHEPSSAPTAVAKNQSTVTHLRGLLAVTSLVRGEDDLDAVLEAIARTIAECLGFGTVAINLYRPAWDDFQVTNVYGNPGAREALLGDARDLASWQPLLDERFLRRGAYVIPHEHFDWADEPEDRLLPPRERLQALRLFANQAATAVTLVEHVQELRFLADHDPLTRLLNRRVFMERLHSEAAPPG